MFVEKMEDYFNSHRLLNQRLNLIHQLLSVVLVSQIKISHLLNIGTRKTFTKFSSLY